MGFVGEGVIRILLPLKKCILLLSKRNVYFSKISWVLFYVVRLMLYGAPFYNYHE